jgi:hypothetical protein
MNFNLLDYPMALRDPRLVVRDSAWVGHVPFGFAIVEMMRPESIVELGVHHGMSYCAFCQAVAELQLRATRCFGIDTWRGDPHVGELGPEVLAALRAHHDPLYSAFSQFVQTDFDTAAAHVAEETIDLLHIDGAHTYDDVRHDFETWLPKMSDRGVILFHDTSERTAGFGVWQLWAQVQTRYPSFEFPHAHGLGVLAVGANVAPAVRHFLAAANQQPERMRGIFGVLGRRIYEGAMLWAFAEFLNATQEYVDDWRRRGGRAVEKRKSDAHRWPLDAITRAAHDVQALMSAATAATPEASEASETSDAPETAQAPQSPSGNQ